jgi:hypothetical protein
VFCTAHMTAQVKVTIEVAGWGDMRLCVAQFLAHQPVPDAALLRTWQDPAVTTCEGGW